MKWIILVLILTIAAVIISSDFLTKPKIWSDEALIIQLTCNFSGTGQMKIFVATNQPSANQHIYNSSAGWVLPFSAAMTFKILGGSFFNGRLTMVFYVIGLLTVIFLLIHRFCGLERVLFPSLL